MGNFWQWASALGAGALAAVINAVIEYFGAAAGQLPSVGEGAIIIGVLGLGVRLLNAALNALKPNAPSEARFR